MKQAENIENVKVEHGEMFQFWSMGKLIIRGTLITPGIERNLRKICTIKEILGCNAISEFSLKLLHIFIWVCLSHPHPKTVVWNVSRTDMGESAGCVWIMTSGWGNCTWMRVCMFRWARWATFQRLTNPQRVWHSLERMGFQYNLCLCLLPCFI